MESRRRRKLLKLGMVKSSLSPYALEWDEITTFLDEPISKLFLFQEARDLSGRVWSKLSDSNLEFHLLTLSPVASLELFCVCTVRLYVDEYGFIWIHSGALNHFFRC